MPEGPEIRIAADKIAKAIALKPIEEMFFAFEHLKPYQEILAKQLVTGVDTKGKGMLIRFDNGLSIYRIYKRKVLRNKAFSVLRI